MTRTALLFALCIAAIAALLLVLSSLTAGRFAPLYPSDVFHAGVISDAGCYTCHTPGKQAALRKEHPPAMNCLACHRPARAR